MVERVSGRIASAIVAAIAVLGAAPPVHGQSAATPYPKMAAIDQYLMAPDAEVTLAKSAAPESISKDADVLVLERHGYHAAIKGRNGFVCMVQRSWTASVDYPGFWNPKLRAPICFNPPAVRSYLPRIVKRTQLALDGATTDQLAAAMKAALDAKEIPAIERGAIGYMLSKQGYLGDEAGHWHPHLMMYAPETEPAEWGANFPASPILATSDHADRATVFMIPVRVWSDGSPDSGDGRVPEIGKR